MRPDSGQKKIPPDLNFMTIDFRFPAGTSLYLPQHQIQAGISMKKLLQLLTWVLFLSTPAMQAEHFTVNLDDFEVLEIRIHGEVDWTSGPANGSLDCSAALFEELEFDQTGKKLIIRWKNTGKPDWKFGTDDLKIHLHSEYLRKADITGSADLRFLTPNKIPDFNLSINGSGDFRGALDCSGTVMMNISGSGDLKVSGQCKNLNLQISGSGDFRGYELKAEKAVVRISGSGDVGVYASSELEAQVSGSGDISYAGNPVKVNSNVSGSGEIRKAKEIR